MSFGTNSSGHEDEPIPNDVDEAIEYLEDKVKSDIKDLESNTPNPIDPVGKQIAHALKARRVKSTAEFVEELKEKDKHTK